MRSNYLLATLLLLTTMQASGAVTIGAALPPLTIEENGEILLEKEAYYYASWTESKNLGKVQMLNYAAGTASATVMNAPFIARLTQEHIDGNLAKGSVAVTTIINIDDAFFGTGGLVVNGVKESKKTRPHVTLVIDDDGKESKKTRPHVTLVIDDDGKGRRTWALEQKSSAIMLLNRSGEVIYFSQGAMSEAEIDTAIELVIAEANREE